MPIALALILFFVMIVVCFIYFLWALVLLIPVYALIATAGYLLWSNRSKASAVSIQQEAEDQRRFNEQETRAWRASLEMERRNETRRDKVLRSLDKSRAPPKK